MKLANTTASKAVGPASNEFFLSSKAGRKEAVRRALTGSNPVALMDHPGERSVIANASCNDTSEHLSVMVEHGSYGITVDLFVRDS